jgi:uncharacterized oligopeptide transporter (OPT) family protein
VQVWAGVSKVFSQGMAALHPTARVGALVGLLLGIGLTLAERFAPKAVRPFVPAPTGLGLAFVLPAYSSFGMFLGAGLAEAYRRKKGTAEDPITPVASGFIAGESLMGIVVAITRVLGG